MLRNIGHAIWAFLMLVAVAQAQFNFFEHMFGANQQQHQQQGSQNVPSDSGRYQHSWRQGESRCSFGSMKCCPLGHQLFTDPGYFWSQLNAATICVPEPSHASPFPTTVHAHTPMLKKKSNWERGVLSACLRADSKLARRHVRSSWPGRAFCDEFACIMLERCLLILYACVSIL